MPTNTVLDNLTEKAWRVVEGGTGAYRPIDARLNLNALYQMQASIEAAPGAAAVVLRAVAPVPMTLLKGGVNCAASGLTAATGTTVFTIYNGVASIGTITFSGSGTVGAFAVTADTAIAAGDLLTIVAPDPADASLALLSFKLCFTY